MASTRVRGAGPVGQEPDLGRVPERMDFVGDWVTGKGEKIELWTDNRIGDGLLVQTTPEWERLATLYFVLLQALSLRCSSLMKQLSAPGLARP
jgi:hypothetical protein